MGLGQALRHGLITDCPALTGKLLGHGEGHSAVAALPTAGQTQGHLRCQGFHPVQLAAPLLGLLLQHLGDGILLRGAEGHGSGVTDAGFFSRDRLER